MPDLPRYRLVRYGLWTPAGDLARLAEVDAGWGDPGGVSYTLTANPDAPPFLAADPVALAAVLAEDVGEYNSTARRPAWGAFRADQLTPVRVEHRVEVAVQAVAVPPVVRPLDTSDCPADVAAALVGHPLVCPPGETPVLVVLAGSPARHAGLVGRPVGCGSLTTTRRVLAVVPFPAEWPLPGGADGDTAADVCLLVCGLAAPFRRFAADGDDAGDPPAGWWPPPAAVRAAPGRIPLVIRS